MVLSGIVMVVPPDRLPELRGSVDAIPWADFHFSDPCGRAVVTIEAADVEQSMDRLARLQSLPHVLMAELAQYCIEDDDLPSPGPGSRAKGPAADRSP